MFKKSIGLVCTFLCLLAFAGCKGANDTADGTHASSSGVFGLEGSPAQARADAEKDDPIDPDEYDAEEILASVESSDPMNAAYMGAWVKTTKMNNISETAETVYWRIINISQQPTDAVVSEAMANDGLVGYDMMYQIYYPEDHTSTMPVSGDLGFALRIKGLDGQDIEGVDGAVSETIASDSVVEVPGSVQTVRVEYRMLPEEPNFVFCYTDSNGACSYIRNR